MAKYTKPKLLPQAPCAAQRLCVKYTWPARQNDPKEVTAVYLTQDQVPRVGELVSISVFLDDTNEVVSTTGRVKDVVWEATNFAERRDPKQATVYLS